MKRILTFSCSLALAAVCCSFLLRDHSRGPLKFPYKQAGLTERQAAAHLLGRFTFGALPGQVDEVAKMGPEKWFAQQLSASMDEREVNRRLQSYDAINMSNEEVEKNFPRQNQVQRMAISDGVINRDSVNQGDRARYRAVLQEYMQKKGIRPQQELFRQFTAQKVVRAAYSPNQLDEVLVDFWFNHFNVSLTKNDCAPFIPAYERDVIRPNVLGKFNTLLLATAKSPAMLYFLDNFNSSGENKNLTPPNSQLRKRLIMSNLPRGVMADSANEQVVKRLQNAKKNQGLNENYAREVMELHTLGVDGGYTQQDVTQAAKVLTGWTVKPMGNTPKLAKAVTATNRLRQGIVEDGDFLFAAQRHDSGEKIVLGKKFDGTGGYQEGVELLGMLAHHPSTARFISTKLATRFVSDHPPKSLIDKMAQTFTAKDGDIREVLLTMVSAPEFWSKETLREKTKSPFELAMSAVRSLNADIVQPNQLVTWVSKMGQKMYYYQAPTGFPDNGPYWINTGSLLNRMNFGLALASQRIAGIKINLTALNNNHEPESAADALQTYSTLLLPERNVAETVKRLTPMLNDPKLGQKIDAAAAQNSPPTPPGDDMEKMSASPDPSPMPATGKPRVRGKATPTSGSLPTGNNTLLAQVVGIIIGSPEFQRK